MSPAIYRERELLCCVKGNRLINKIQKFGVNRETFLSLFYVPGLFVSQVLWKTVNNLF